MRAATRTTALETTASAATGKPVPASWGAEGTWDTPANTNVADRPFPEPSTAILDEATNLSNKRQARCSSCGRVLASVSSFDAHQRVNEAGVATSLRSTVIPRLLLRPDGVWGRADQHPAEAAGAHAEVDA